MPEQLVDDMEGEADAAWPAPSAPPSGEHPDPGPARAERAERLREHAVLQRRAQFVRLEFPAGTEALLRVLTEEAYRTPGDSGAAQDARPAWFDGDLFLEGQRVARDHHPGIAEAEMLSLFLLFAFPAGLDPLVATGRSDTPEAACRRYLSTNMRLMSWYSSDPFDARSDAHRDLVAVRRMHAAVRSACNEASPEQLARKFVVGQDSPRALLCPKSTLFEEAFSALPPGPYLGPCPARPVGDGVALGAVEVHADRYRRPFLTQGEMAITQWGFLGLFICKPDVFAAPHISTRELEALVHMWAVLGYCLGIEDRFNWCLGGLDTVLQRSEAYLRSVAVPNLRTLGRAGASLWEHMSRCMVEGTGRFVPLASFDVHLAYLAEDVLGLGLQPLAKALSWREALQLWRLRLFLQLLPRWLPAWGRWMSRGLRRILRAKAATLLGRR